MPDETLHIDDLCQAALDIVARARLGEPGQFRRHANQAEVDQPNPYAVADAANLYYTLNAMPRADDVREGIVGSLRDMQDPAGGLWHEQTHHPYHMTAHCLAALELFDARPAHRLAALDRYATHEGIVNLLESLEWVERPWQQSHLGAGVFAALLLVDEAPRAWRDVYFDWLSRATDPDAGLLRRGCLPGQAEGSKPVHEHMAGTFHYLFNVEADRRPIPHPERLIDSCLGMIADEPSERYYQVGFLMIDWVFCLNRARRQCGHRFDESSNALRANARRFVTHLRSLDPLTDGPLNDLHRLFGVVCALAEFQLALPGEVVTERPLRNVLDRRPFI